MTELPPAAIATQPAVGHVGKRRNPLAAWLGLPLITLGIYYLVWYFKTNNELALFDRRIRVSAAMSLIAVMFGWILLVPPFVSIYKTGNRIRSAQAAAGVTPSCSGGLGLLLAFLLGLHAFYYTAESNKVWARYGNAIPGSQVTLVN